MSRLSSSPTQQSFVTTLKNFPCVWSSSFGQIDVQGAHPPNHLQCRESHPSSSHFGTRIPIRNFQHFVDESVRVGAQISREGRPQSQAKRDAFHPCVPNGCREKRRKRFVLFLFGTSRSHFRFSGCCDLRRSIDIIRIAITGCHGRRYFKQFHQHCENRARSRELLRWVLGFEFVSKWMCDGIIILHNLHRVLF